MTIGNLKFFGLGVPFDGDYFQSVQQGLGDIVEIIRRHDEQNLREIEGNVEIVVGERAVLFRVKNLK